MKTLNTFGVSFFVRRNREVNGSVPVFIRIIVNGNRVDISAKQKVEIKNWDSARGFGKGQSPEVKRMNTYLERLRGMIVEYYQELKLSKKPFTVEDIRNKYLGVKENEHTLMELFDYHDEISKNVLAHATIKHYRVTKRYFQFFLKKQMNQSDIFLSCLNYKFIVDFEAFIQKKNFLNEKQPCGKNAMMKHIVRLRKIVNLAIKNEWIERDPFTKFKVSYIRTNREYLSLEDLKKIEEKQFTIARLQQVKDLFIFSCYTGLAYIDTFNLTPQHVSLGIDGEFWISTSRVKTDQPVRIPILPKAMEIIQKYKTNPEVVIKGKLLPSLTNQKLNSYLKEIADICGITKPLTFHIARHTFATTVTLTNGVPIETVSKMLGHSSIKTTQIYAKVIESKVSCDMMTLKNKLEIQNQIISNVGM
jgi:integrase/recombinase XerD